MKTLSLGLLIVTLAVLAANTPPKIEEFTPQGYVKALRQVRVRFSDAMVPFGDTRVAVSPFEVRCPEKGEGRWSDTKNWVYQFERDVPSGVKCDFALNPTLKTVKGADIAPAGPFSFNTGGPRVLSSIPHSSTSYSEGIINEDQIFLLHLDGEVDENSLVQGASFAVEDLVESVPVRVFTGEEKKKIIKGMSRWSRPQEPFVAIQAKQKFPAGREVKLIWGTGIKTKSGVFATKAEEHRYRVRQLLTGDFSCQRENPQAACIPFSPMSLTFSAEISADAARKIVVRGPGGKLWHPDIKPGVEWISYVSVNGPFPEQSDFTVEIPTGLRDDAGRVLSNQNRFPLAVKTARFPPLVKFPSRFGLLEAADPVLPVTVRNVEAVLSGKVVTAVNGKMARISSAAEVVEWLRRVQAVKREVSLFADGKTKTSPLSVPRPSGEKPFEVVGIPLKEKGFWVVELESKQLGSALIGPQSTMYVPSSALVTNMAVHFKWGGEASLVWVTSLDSGRPVADAEVMIFDDEGKPLFKGKTNKDGYTKVGRELPEPKYHPYPYDEVQKSRIGSGLLVTATKAGDLSFVHSNWNEGIEPWRFSLSYGRPANWKQKLGHVVLARSLLRAGETVHMKHFFRLPGMQGFRTPAAKSLPNFVEIVHAGSDEKVELPLAWDSQGIAESIWKIPERAKLGHYSVFYRSPSEREKVAAEGDSEEESYRYDNGRLYAGHFRVEEFRVPLMQGIVKLPAEPLARPKEVPVDVQISYLSGGGAAGLPIKLRYQMNKGGWFASSDYEKYNFSYAKIEEGVKRTDYADGGDEEPQPTAEGAKTLDLVLDANGGLRTKIEMDRKLDEPQTLTAEVEYRDSNGEVQTVATSQTLWPADIRVGLRVVESDLAENDTLSSDVVVLDLEGKPVAHTAVILETYQTSYRSHRKRLVGGLYGYENSHEVKKIGKLCEGKTDRKGLLHCEAPMNSSGQFVITARAKDKSGTLVTTTHHLSVYGKDEFWFRMSESDRIDLIPDRKSYEPGETARIQVRMPFREATALVSVEREGVLDSEVKVITGKLPVIEVPLNESHAPNIFVSVLAVRGRVGDVQPTSMVDLGRPAYKLGITPLRVGWKGHELKVKVSTDKTVYKVRDKAVASVVVGAASGAKLAKGAEVAIAAVDEGLLLLQPNDSWQLLRAMMNERSLYVETSSAQMHVIGKRHFGLKAVPSGGGGGKGGTRELFDTLLLWKGRVKLNDKGEARVEIPLNDSLSSFKIVAIASAGLGSFGTGETSIRTTQDLMVLSGLPTLLRENDKLSAGITARNASENKMEVEVQGQVVESKQVLGSQIVELSPGEAKRLDWPVTVPEGATELTFVFQAKGAGTRDQIKVKSKVIPVVPVRVHQGTLERLDKPVSMPVQRPAEAELGRGGVNVIVKKKLGGDLSGVRKVMAAYPYSCLEQRVSKAIALTDRKLWDAAMEQLPTYLDAEGLVKYFPSDHLLGSDTLTAYVLSIAAEARYPIPDFANRRMVEGLKGFVEGRVVRGTGLPTADFTLRKIAALEALARAGHPMPEAVSTLAIDPAVWPTSSVIDWMNLLSRVEAIPSRETLRTNAENLLKSRLNFAGRAMLFSTEKNDGLWWLMVSGDHNAVKTLLLAMDYPQLKQDVGRIVKGVLFRQKNGAWDLTLANAWGVLAMNKYTAQFENVDAVGAVTGSYGGKSSKITLAEKDPAPVLFPWADGQKNLQVSYTGKGIPWVEMESLAAIPTKTPNFKGFKIKKSIQPVEEKQKGKKSEGDIYRVTLELESQSDMTWVVVNDPIPAGSQILGGLQRESLADRKGPSGWSGYPSFTERSYEAFRAYYDFLQKGTWKVEYTLRLNNRGSFQLPSSRVEAMYLPEMFGELPNSDWKVE